MESWETLPCAAMELMARGITVIAADIGGPPELVRDGETGWLFPPGDAALRSRLAVGGREFILGLADAETYYRNLMTLYEGTRGGAASFSP